MGWGVNRLTELRFDGQRRKDVEVKWFWRFQVGRKGREDRAMRMFCFDVCCCGSIALGFLYAAVTAGDDDAFSCCGEMGVRCFCVRPYRRTFRRHRRNRDDEFDAV